MDNGDLALYRHSLAHVEIEILKLTDFRTMLINAIARLEAEAVRAQHAVPLPLTAQDVRVTAKEILDERTSPL